VQQNAATLRRQGVTVTREAPQQFAEWVAARGGALQRFAYLTTGSRDDAADLVQEALTRVFPRWAALAARGTAEAYVRRTIVNVAISRWRKDHRLLTGGTAEPAPAPDSSQRQADSDHAWSLCAALPPQQRAAVVLRFYEDLSFAEIGRVLGCPEATARSHVHRALASLRARLTASEEDS
jgi:RNA polymerase sigma-70 factor (sigma-E family)